MRIPFKSHGRRLHAAPRRGCLFPRGAAARNGFGASAVVGRRLAPAFAAVAGQLAMLRSDAAAARSC